MKFTVPVQTLLEPITRVANISNSKLNNPEDVSRFLYFKVSTDSLTITGTDLNVNMKVVIPLPAGACESEGEFLLKANKASEFFKSLGPEDDVEMALDEESNTVNVASGVAKFTIMIRPVPQDESMNIFKLPDLSTAVEMTIEENVLRYMIEKSSFCVSRDNYREYLRGIRFEAIEDNLSVFALDGHRMAVLETKLSEPVSKPCNFLMTLRGASELQKLLSGEPEHPLKVAITDDCVVTELGMYTIMNKLLKTEYPNVRSVIPKDVESTVPISVNMLKTYVKRLSLFSNRRINAINIQFSANNLALRTQNNDNEIASANLEINYAEYIKDIELNLNADFLLDFLGSIDSQDVLFSFIEPYHNTMLRPSSEVNDLGINLRYIVSHIVV